MPFDVVSAKSDMSDFNVYAGCAKSEYVYHFSTETPDSFYITYFGTENRTDDEDYEMSDIAEEIQIEWIPAVVDGIECFVLIRTDSIAFMRVPADKSEITWIENF